MTQYTNVLTSSGWGICVLIAHLGTLFVFDNVWITWKWVKWAQKKHHRWTNNCWFFFPVESSHSLSTNYDTGSTWPYWSITHCKILPGFSTIKMGTRCWLSWDCQEYNQSSAEIWSKVFKRLVVIQFFMQTHHHGILGKKRATTSSEEDAPPTKKKKHKQLFLKI